MLGVSAEQAGNAVNCRARPESAWQLRKQRTVTLGTASIHTLKARYYGSVSPCTVSSAAAVCPAPGDEVASGMARKKLTSPFSSVASKV
jgi:hypothetical protein